jgi:putative membrane protein
VKTLQLIGGKECLLRTEGDHLMPMSRIVLISSSLIAFSTFFTGAACAAESLSDVDKAFVAKVSQGGMYEVALGKVAGDRGGEQDVKDQGNTEVHDHELVGSKLKSISGSAGLSFPSELNAEFKARLDKMNAFSGAKFDAAYVEDMKKIHAADGAAFLDESKDGTNADLKAFAAETYNIVQRHIGELDAKTRPQ